MTLNKNLLQELTPEQQETSKKLQAEEKQRASAAIKVAQAMLLASTLSTTQRVRKIHYG